MKRFTILRTSILVIAYCIALMATAKPVTPSPFEVEITGHGNRAIIFIPGFASSGKVWATTREKFEKIYTCYTLTMPGFAAALPQANASFAAWESNIAQYIRDHKIEKPIVVGHSMGGVLALALAADYPELIGKIVVVDALPCLAAMSNPNFKASEKPDCTAMVAQMTNMTNEQFQQMQQMSVRSMSADTTQHRTIVGWSMKSDRATMGQMFCDFMNTDVRSRLGSIQCPALILLQPYFKNFGGAIEAQYQGLRTANVQYATKGLHFIMFDDQDWYLHQLNSFVTAQ